MKFKTILSGILFVCTLGLHKIYNIFEVIWRGKINANTVHSNNTDYAIQQFVLNSNLAVWLWVVFGLTMVLVWSKLKK